MILSIESSCDDSSIAITEIKSKKLIFHKKISQDADHNKYGGVVPELASRLHAKALPDILVNCKKYFKHLKAIAVVNEPGLSVTLIEGIMMAKALSISLSLPIIKVNHLKGHIYSTFIEKEAIFPQNIILLSGGHTMIIKAKNKNSFKIIATTLDDSFGESFDKVAKMLSLGYPGGPIVEKRAKNGFNRFGFPIPLQNQKRLAFSFSGLKNATRIAINSIDKNKDEDINDICASFQRSAILHIIQKSKAYLKNSDIKNLLVVGGASANKALQAHIKSLAKDLSLNIAFPEFRYCSDNAAMIGRVALEAFAQKDFVNDGDLKESTRSTCF